MWLRTMPLLPMMPAWRTTTEPRAPAANQFSNSLNACHCGSFFSKPIV